MNSKVVQAARIGNSILNLVSVAGIVSMLLMGGYIVWYTVMVYQSAFLDNDLLNYKPSLDNGLDNPSLYELMELNPDVCAWITIDGTNIDYPVVQGKNNQEYLNKDVYGDFSLSGTIFLDSANNRNFTDPYNILYGHHMDNGSVFGEVIEFLDDEYFNTYPTGILFLPDSTYAISFFACMQANAYDSMVLSVNKQSTAMPAFLSYVHNNAKQYRDLTPALSASDRIISLVTCEDSNTDGRAVLLGRLNQIETINQEEAADEAAEKERLENREKEWYEDEP